MHEISVATALLRQVEEEASKRQASAVQRITVRVGALSGVDVQLLQTAYQACRASTLCARAVLEIVQVPARWSCSRCAAEVAGGTLTCSQCRRPASLSGGDELLLDTIEMEVAHV